MNMTAQKEAASSARLERMNHMVRAYGESIRLFFREQQRSSMVSPLFNIPGRMVLGGYCYYEALSELLRWLLQYDTAEAIACRMKRPCSLPNYISLNSLMIGYLNGREQSCLLGRAGLADLDDIAMVLDFWSRAASAYRNDGGWLPDDHAFTIPILPREAVERVAAELVEPDNEAKHRIRRMMATLELYTFILNGESRIGVFHHGPYALPDGDAIVFKEMVGLQEDFYSWATPDLRLPYPSIVRVLRLRGVKSKIVLMGSMTTEPRSYEDLVVAEQVFVAEGGELRPLTKHEMTPLTQAAANAQLQLYRRVADWNDWSRVAYGAELYGCILQTFAPEGRREEFRSLIREAFHRVVQQHADDLLSGRERPLILEHIATTNGPIYSPIEASR